MAKNHLWRFIVIFFPVITCHTRMHKEPRRSPAPPPNLQIMRNKGLGGGAGWLYRSVFTQPDIKGAFGAAKRLHP